MQRLGVLVENLWNTSTDPLDALALVRESLADEPLSSSEVSGGSRVACMVGASLIGYLLWQAIQGFLRGVDRGLAESSVLLPLPPPSSLVWGVIALLLPMASAFVFNGGLALRFQGLEVRTLAGEPARQWSVLARSLPLAIGTGAASYLFTAGKAEAAVFVALLIAPAALLRGALRPTRSLGDLLVGTILRPR